MANDTKNTENKKNNNTWKTLIFLLAVFLFLFFFFKADYPPIRENITISKALSYLKNGDILEVICYKHDEGWILKDKLGHYFWVNITDWDGTFKKLLDIPYINIIVKKPNYIMRFFYSGLPSIIFSSLFGWWLWNVVSKSVSISSTLGSLDIKNPEEGVTFDSIAGLEDAKKEIKEVADMLVNEEKYKKLRCRLVRGIILHGPPGNGKTLLAKALASATGSYFISVTASSLNEIWVGMGAKKLRDIFDKAYANQPSIIFFDEMDSIGSRSDKRIVDDSTINEFLAQTDGIKEKGKIVIIAATNFLSSIDEALLRPGRFDRKIYIPTPEEEARRKLFNLYTKDIPLKEVNLSLLVDYTKNLSSSTLETIINEAKLFAIREDRDYLIQKDFDNAIDKVVYGAFSAASRMSYKEEVMTAYHESCHAFIAYYNNHLLGRIYKLTIVPHDFSLGRTIFIDKDKSSQTKGEIKAYIMTALAGLLGEKIFLGNEQMSTGAISDLSKARELAEHYIISGLSEEYGLTFIGRERGEKEKSKLFKEVDKLISKLSKETEKILLKRKKVIEILVKELLNKKTLLGNEVTRIIEYNGIIPYKKNHLALAG